MLANSVMVGGGEEVILVFGESYLGFADLK
jgi:hypothetical protein